MVTVELPTSVITGAVLVEAALTVTVRVTGVAEAPAESATLKVMLQEPTLVVSTVPVRSILEVMSPSWAS